MFFCYTALMTFAEKVYTVVSKIPRGSVMTYAEVAKKAGNPKAFRAVGNILNKNYNPDIPCHRVVRSDGTAGGYNRGAANKIKILQHEQNDLTQRYKGTK